MDRGHPAAARMVDDLDPPGGLDGARRMDHLVDLRPGEPAEQGHEQRGDAGDQGPGQRRRPALSSALARELGLVVQRRRGASVRPRSARRLQAGAGCGGRVSGQHLGRASPPRRRGRARAGRTRSQACEHRRPVGDHDTVRPLPARRMLASSVRLGRGIERAGRLVEHQHARVAHDRAGDARSAGAGPATGRRRARPAPSRSLRAAAG